jgi:hypothetical protein
MTGGRDQEDHSSKPAPGKQFMRPYLEKNASQKRADGVAQSICPEPQYWERKKQKQKPIKHKQKNHFNSAGNVQTCLVPEASTQP